MQKALGRARSRGRETISMPEPKAELADLAAVRKEISRVVGSEAVGMVRRIIAEINISHYTAMKYLFELAGLYPATTQEETEGDDSLARTLLSRLGLEDGPMLESGVTKDREMEAIASAADAVE